MPEYLTPGVYFDFRDAAPAVRGLRTDITGFVGLAERGPLDTPVRIDSWRQFQGVFGSFVRWGYLAYGVKGFFENGGRTCYVVRVAGSSAAAATMTLRNEAEEAIISVAASSEGTWGAKIIITLVATNATSGTFTLRATKGTEMELFRNLSIDPASERYFETIINEGDESMPRSQLITVEALALPPVDMLPNAEASGLKNRSGFLRGGHDGLASLSVDDLIGETGSLDPEGGRGLSELERVDAVAIVAIPDIHIRPSVLPPEPPPKPTPPHDPCMPSKPEPVEPGAIVSAASDELTGFTESEVERLQQAMVEHCELMGDRVAVLDAPLTTGSERSLTITEIESWRGRFDSERGFAALYYPWVSVVDPIAQAGNGKRFVPPSGHIAGLYARLDFETGVHKAPANAELEWADDVMTQIGEEEQGILNPAGVNCIRAFPGRGIRVYGARTISSDSDWRYINVRRLMLMIEEAIDEATQWSVFEPHDFNLRQKLILSASSFLEAIWRRGGLAGATREEAFFVRCDDSNNPQDSVDAGRIIIDIGVAPAIPAEFIVFRIGRTTEELESVER